MSRYQMCKRETQISFSLVEHCIYAYADCNFVVNRRASEDQWTDWDQRFHRNGMLKLAPEAMTKDDAVLS
jgi:hypothetical protein